jgi:hypothetical protein
MANTQLIIFTPVPTSLKLNPATIKVSVLVSPRLRGDDKLAAYPDWLNWTETRKESGLRVTFECSGARLTVEADTSQLRTDLWQALFNAETYVRSHHFDDYSGEFVSSYGAREALGLLKATYQTVGVEFALPTDDGDPRERTARRRGRFESLVSPYALQWSDEKGRRLRAELRDRQRRLRDQLGALTRSSSALAGVLDESGLIVTGTLDPDSTEFRDAQTSVAEEFGVFNHAPQGASVTRESLDDARVLDFHQALSSLGAYPDLMRKLGLVFDLELPLDFVARTTSSAPGQLDVAAVEGNWNSDTATTVPRTSTAYIHETVEGQELFGVAPRSMFDRVRRPHVLGLLTLDKRWFGVAQVDVDGAMHKTVMHADNLSQLAGESVPQRPEVFDPATTLASLRSGGLSLFADSRALSMLATFNRSKELNADLENNTPQKSPFCAEDLTRGYRLDVWDSVTGDWHSLHRKNTRIRVGEQEIELTVEDEEGFFQAAATQAAPNEDGSRDSTDIYLHEAIVRWAGWSLSAETVGIHLTRAADPDRAIPNPAEPDPENEAVTPFKLTSSATHIKGSLPRLRFGVGYRLRVRQVDLAGNGLHVDDPETALLTPGFSMPRGNGVIPYLRFEPVVAPTIVLRDKLALTGAGSSSDRLVIRTFNTAPSLDEADADLTASERHVAPPNVHVEMAERHGMFDDANGKLIRTPAMWQLIKQRDESTFHQEEFDEIVIDGKKQSYPVEFGAQIDPLPYLPDPLARSAAFRNLPGTPSASIGRAVRGVGAEQPITYQILADPQPRPGSATIIEFGGRTDWQEVKPFRLALADGDAPPSWDPQEAVLTVSLPKGTTHVVPVSSCCDPDDLKYLGIWQWLREYMEHITVTNKLENDFFKGPDVKDRIAHILQLAIEGGHGMLTPPHLLTLVHAVQQPIGIPAFGRLTGQLDPQGTKMQTEPETEPTAATELDVLTAWRGLGATDAWLVGALHVHGSSTAKVDIRAAWTDPFDPLIPDVAGNIPDPGQQDFAAQVDEVPLPVLDEDYLESNGENRKVGFYDPDHDLICFAPAGTSLGNRPEGESLEWDSMPRHQIGDTRHHVVTYTPVATSRYRDYFPKSDGAGNDLDFTRTGAPVTVHVPASARPVAPHVRYVVPTFGWERATSANQVRSVRTGGGLRIYLDRPWHSSGVGELLGVSLAYDGGGGAIDREEWKPFITQWGQDPVWLSTPLAGFPGIDNFPDATASERALPLEERMPTKAATHRLVDVVGHEVEFDPQRKLYYCDLTVDIESATYAPFIRLALVRYQPHALVEAKLSRVVLADFAQLTPERALMVTADPYVPGVIRVAVSGPAPRGPLPQVRDAVESGRPTVIEVSVQVKDPDVNSDLAWSTDASFAVNPGPLIADAPSADFILWSGSVRHVGAEQLEAGRYRLLIQEHELYETDDEHADGAQLGKRLIYAETIPLDDSLLQPPPFAAASTTI